MPADTTDQMLLSTPILRAPHGFTTRAGGVSVGPFAALNLDDREDDATHVAENRRRLVSALGFTPDQVSRLMQVHGHEVVQARPGAVQTADAQVSGAQGVLLVIGTADCYPVLLEDAEAGVLGAAHAGWRGTLADIVGSTVRAMEGLGAQAGRVRAAVGPGICAAQYRVGEEVAQAFVQAGLGAHVQDLNGELHLDLCAANVALLLRAGVRPPHVWTADRCSTEPEFYSYRRDAGRTGRMWAVIGRPAGGRA